MGLHKSPDSAEHLREEIKEAKTPIPPLTSDAALALFVDIGLSKSKYQALRNAAPHTFPAYNDLRVAKKQCYPSNISASSTSVVVPLQDMVNHTTSRLLSYLDPVLITLSEEQLKNITMLYKWGMDGSGDHSLYKQNFPDSEENCSDSNIFFVTKAPVLMFTRNSTGERVVLWANPRPSSKRYCRPIRLTFAKETKELVEKEMATIEEEITVLAPTETSTSTGANIVVQFIMKMTMVDGKIVSIVTRKSCQRCCVCGATPKDMNKLEKLDELTLDTTAYDLGLSVLHARIRFMECILHIAYRIEIKAWSVVSDEDKKKRDARKKEIQDKLRAQMGLLVDLVKSGGSTNDGNTARKFFENWELAAEITQVDAELIRRFSVILTALNSGHEINVHAFDKYCRDTYSLYIRLYPWYFMPASVHKILRHGPAIIAASECPVGWLSEEGSEATHRDMRYFRLNFTRKFDRVVCTLDLFLRLCISSDIVLSNNRKLRSKCSDPFPQEVLNLLQCPTVPSYNAEAGDIISESQLDLTDTESLHEI